VKHRFFIDIFETGTVNFGSDDDVRFDEHAAMSSDIDAMLTHIKATYYEIIKQVQQ
jgi:hypothetical protein